MDGVAGMLKIHSYTDLIKCLKLNFKKESICQIHCVGCGGKLSYGINKNCREICACCWHAVFVDKEKLLLERVQNLLKFNQYCKSNEIKAFQFFVDILDYYTDFRFVHARNQIEQNITIE